MEDRYHRFISGEGVEDLPKELAKEIESNSTSLLSLVENLGIYLTSTKDESRARATRLLSSVLHNIKNQAIVEKEVDHLVEFYCDRLRDRVSILPQVFYGLQALVLFSNFTGQSAVRVSQALFKEIHLQAHPQAERHMVYNILGHILARHTDALKTLNNDFVFGYIKLMEGEKDPRNLLVVFQTILGLLEHLPFDLFVEDLFEVTACYFPIDFQPPPNDPYGITREELILSLRHILAATPKFSEFCLPLLLEKLSSDVPSAKLDSLRTLAMCAPVYGPSGLQPFLEPIWYGLRQEIFQGTNDEVEIVALDAVREVGRGVKLGVKKAEDKDSLKEFIGLILKDCTRHFIDPELKLVTPATKILRSLSSSSVSAFNIVLDPILPIVLEQFQSREMVSHKCITLETLVEFMREVAAHSGQVEDVPETLKLKKEKVIEIILSTLHSSSDSLRRIAICGVAVVLGIPNFLDTQELIHCGQKLTDLALGDRKDDVKRESAHTLAVMSRSFPAIVTETVVPFLLRSIGCGTDSMETDAINDDEKDGVSPSEKDLPIIHLLTALSVHHGVCQVTLPVLVTCLESMSASRTPSLPKEECLKLAEELAQQLVTVIESNKSDQKVIKSIGPLLGDLLRVCVVEATHTLSKEDCIVTSGSNLTILSKVFGLFVQNTSERESAVECSRVVVFFLEGELSLIDLSDHSLQSVRLLSTESPETLTNLVIILKECVASLAYETLSRFYDNLVPALLNLALLCRNSFTYRNAAKGYSALVNKVPGEEETTSIASKGLDLAWRFVEEDTDIEGRVQAVEVLLWICRGLVVRSHPLGQHTVVKLLHLTEDHLIAGCVGQHFGILLEDTQDILNQDCRAVLRIMYKQQFFVQTLPVVMELIASAQEEVKSSCFQVLSHMFRHVPKQILLGELSNLIPLLVKSLNYPDVELRISSLESLHLLIEDTPSSITAYVPTLIPILLNLAKSPETMRLRLPALQCIAAMTSLPHHTVYPFRNTVIKGVLSCLDDKKRLVRKEATRTRSKWYLLGAI